MVSFFFHPDYSGSAVQALNLSRHLQRLGVEPLILSANLSGSPEQDTVQGVPVRRVPVASNPALQIPSFWAAVARFLVANRHAIDIVHAHGTVQHGIVGPVGRVLRKPTILKIAMANSDLAFDMQGRLNGRLNRAMVLQFDRYMATTRAIAAEMRERGLAADRVRLVPNGVDTDLFRVRDEAGRVALRRQLGLPEGPLATCVAIVNGRKNIDGLLRIWRNVVARGGPGHLLIIGPVPEPEGPYHRQLLEFVAANGLGSRVTFLGRRDDVPTLLSASDVFVFPSRQEGMPNSVLEAMACGLPPVVSLSAGTEDIVRQGTDGFLVDPSDEPAFADVTARLLDSPALRASVGAAARQSCMERFSLAAVAQAYLALYHELLGRPAESVVPLTLS